METRLTHFALIAKSISSATEQRVETNALYWSLFSQVWMCLCVLMFLEMTSSPLCSVCYGCCRMFTLFVQLTFSSCLLSPLHSAICHWSELLGKQETTGTVVSNWSTENRGLFKRRLFGGGLIRKQQVLLSEGHQIPWGGSRVSRGNVASGGKSEGHFKLYQFVTSVTGFWNVSVKNTGNDGNKTIFILTG